MISGLPVEIDGFQFTFVRFWMLVCLISVTLFPAFFSLSMVMAFLPLLAITEARF